MNKRQKEAWAGMLLTALLVGLLLGGLLVLKLTLHESSHSGLAGV